MIKIFEEIFKDSTFEQIKCYLQELENDKEIRSHIRDSINNSKLKEYADSKIEFSRRLGWYICVRLLKPKVIVETGVDKGLGSVVLIRGLMKNKEEGYAGYYYGTDINPEAGYLLNGDYNKHGEILYGDSIKTLNKYDLAIKNYLKAIEIKSDFPSLHNNLGNAYKQIGELENAVESYKTGLTFNPDYLDSHK